MQRNALNTFIIICLFTIQDYRSLIENAVAFDKYESIEFNDVFQNTKGERLNHPTKSDDDPLRY